MDKKDQLTFRTLFLLWFPLFLAWIVLHCEEAVVSAIVARLGAAKFNLAIMQVTLSISLFFESAIFPIISAATVICRNRNSLTKLYTFTMLLSIFLSVLILITASTPVARFLTLEIFKMDIEFFPLVQLSLSIYAISPIVVAYRRFCQGLLIQQGKSKLISYCSIIRLTAIIAGAFILLSAGFPGAIVGAGGIVSGLIADAIFSRLSANSIIKEMLKNDKVHNNNLDLKSIAKFYFPLSISSIINYISFPIMNFFVTFGSSPIESLAVLPVIISILYLLKSIGISYHEIVVANWNVGNDKENNSIIKGAYILSFASLLISILVICTPFLKTLLSQICGLNEELTIIATLPLRICFLIPFLSVIIMTIKGKLICLKIVNPITNSTIIELISIVLVMFIGTNLLHYNGALVTAFALSISQILGLGWLWKVGR